VKTNPEKIRSLQRVKVH